MVWSLAVALPFSVIFWNVMAKPRITMTGLVCRTNYRVIYGDTDAGGVVYNANYLRICEIGRSELMRRHVMAYSEIERNDLILPVTESYLRYKAPARYDDLLTVDTCIAEVSRFTCRFHYRILRQGEERQQLLVKGFTVHAAIHREGKLTPLPEYVLKKMEKLTQTD
jgi:acyl-CoA thioester hydrolase